jgi:hypothetical protein
MVIPIWAKYHARRLLRALSRVEVALAVKVALLQ